jgi:hypothetical protein
MSEDNASLGGAAVVNTPFLFGNSLPQIARCSKAAYIQQEQLAAPS